MRALQRALRLRIPGFQNHPPQLKRTAERGKVRRRPAARRDRRLAIPHQLLRQRPQPREVPRQPPEDVRRLLAEHQRPRDRARPTHLTCHHPATTLLTMTNRQVLAGLPQITLHKLARPIDRPLKRPRPDEPRPRLTDIVIKDRLAARIADLARHLAQPLRLNPRISRQLVADPVLERIELRSHRCARIPRRLPGRQRPPDRLAMQPRPPADLPDRQLLDSMQPSDLCPLLHADHPRFLPVRSR